MHRLIPILLLALACRADEAPYEGDDAGAENEGGGGAVVQSDEQDVGAGDDGWRPSATILLDCPWLAQVPPGDWDNTMNCGPTSLVMVDACLDGTGVSSDDTLTLIQWMDGNVSGYSTGSNYNGVGTSTSQLADVSGRYFGRQAERVTGATLQSVYEELVAKRPVIVVTHTQGANNHPSDVMVSGSPHFMVVVGMTATHVVLHDPGRSQSTHGEDRYYTIESFHNYWQGGAGVTFPGGTTEPECEDNDYHQCDVEGESGDVYYYDSCGTQGDLREPCGSDEACENTSSTTADCQDTCGNGAVDSTEDCDDSDLDGETCESIGHDGGELDCEGDCDFDESGCCDDSISDDTDYGDFCDGSSRDIFGLDGTTSFSGSNEDTQVTATFVKCDDSEFGSDHDCHVRVGSYDGSSYDASLDRVSFTWEEGEDEYTATWNVWASESDWESGGTKEFYLICDEDGGDWNHWRFESPMTAAGGCL